MSGGPVSGAAGVHGVAAAHGTAAVEGTASVHGVALAGRRVRIARMVLVWAGVLVLAFGAYTMVETARTAQIWGLLRWLLGAVILHDAILSPFVVLVGVLLRRSGRTLRPWALVVVQAAVVVGAVLAVTVLPEIAAQHHGAKNPTVLPFDYTLRLLVAEAVLAAVVVAALLVGRAVRRAGAGGAGRSRRR